jgi:hypothetical protein
MELTELKALMEKERALWIAHEEAEFDARVIKRAVDKGEADAAKYDAAKQATGAAISEWHATYMAAREGVKKLVDSLDLPADRLKALL